jgi:hypothetical protein
MATLLKVLNNLADSKSAGLLHFASELRWEHRLTVTDVRAGNPSLSYPRYVGGERNGPPEDCGGIPGFYEMLDAAADPKHPDHAEAKQWLDDYDPNAIEELPIKYALGRIANQRNAAKGRLARRRTE